MLTPGHGLGKHFWQEMITSKNGGRFYASTSRPDDLKQGFAAAERIKA